MVPVGSYWFLNIASVFVDGYYLYIIIHYEISQRGWGIRSVPMGGRPDPKSKAIDTYV